MSNINRTSEKGATLVEVLIYTIIVTLLISLVVYVLIAISKLERHVSALRAVESSAMATLENISREVRGATSINEASSIFNSDSGRLVLNVPNGSGGTKTVDFWLVSGLVHVADDGVDLGPLTVAQASTTRMLFRLISNGDIRGVKVELRVGSGDGDYYKTKNFYSTATVRSSY